jgi:hypothetical protein
MTAYSNDISAQLSGLPGMLCEFPCVDKTVGSVVFWSVFASFCVKLEQALIRGRDGKWGWYSTCVLKTWTCPSRGWRITTCEAALPTNQSPPKTSIGAPFREYG